MNLESINPKRRLAIELFVHAVAALGACRSAHAATLISHTRSISTNATITASGQTVTDPMADSSTLAGVYQQAVTSLAELGGSSTFGDASQGSDVQADSMSGSLTTAAGYAIEGGATGASSANTVFTVTFDVPSTEFWAVDGDATISGALANSAATLRLMRGSVVILDISTTGSAGGFSIERTLSLTPGQYTIEAQCDSSFTGIGTGFENSSATLSLTFDRSATGPCAGDANGDGAVNFEDLNITLSQYGQTGAPGSLSADFDLDGDVDFRDLNVVLAAFGTTC